MKELTVPSGAAVRISPAPFGDAFTLKNAVFREWAAAGVQVDLQALNGLALDVSPLLNAGLMIDTSPAVQSALWTCLTRCTYNEEKITQQTFQPDDARQDFYAIAIECMRENLNPFVKGLFALLPKGKSGPTAGNGP